VLFLLCRLLPKVLAWLLKRKFFIEVQIGRIGIPYLTLKDVHISKNGFSMVSFVPTYNLTISELSCFVLSCVNFCHQKIYLHFINHIVNTTE